MGSALENSFSRSGRCSIGSAAVRAVLLAVAPLLFFACDAVPDGLFTDEASIGEIVRRSTVVERGTKGYEIFRIPVLVQAPNGDLLLFAEGRATASDFGDVDVLLFRSTNGGATWREPTVIADNGEDTASDMAAVVDEGRVHLFYQERPGGRTFEDYLQGEASDARGFHLYSDDSGLTWSDPVDITGQVLPAPDEQLPMFGPNNGIVLDSGRIVVPMYYANQSADAWTPAVIYSGDGGETWRRSADAFPGQGVNETAVVQFSNSDVYAIARDNSGDGNERKRFLRSTDRATTWTESGDVSPRIPGPGCQQSMVSSGDRVYLSTPRLRARRDGRLKTGIYDPERPDNVQWSEADLQITPDGFAYSSMTRQDSTLHLVYEENTEEGYISLQYVQVRLP